MIKIINGSVIRNGAIEKTNLYIECGKIKRITNENLPADTVIDAAGKYVSPGFIDTHVHGGGNADFMDGGIEPMRVAAKTHLLHGTTSISPTTLSCPYEDLKTALLDYKELTLESGKCGMPNLIGMHFEGPYFALSQAGAQPPSCIYPPKKAEYEELLSIAEGAISKWSFAPELPGALEFCEKISNSGIVASIGHTEATYDDVLAAYEHGASCMTHFYSCMPTITRKNGYRIPGAVEAAYLLRDMWIEVIADGSHIPPVLLKMIVANRGVERMLLITDAMRGATMPEGPSILGRLEGGHKCIIENGIALMPDRTCFAGSVATTDRLVRTFYKNNVVTLPVAVELASLKPAQSLGLKTKGALREGYDADIIFFDDNINVSFVMVNGTVVKS